MRQIPILLSYWRIRHLYGGAPDYEADDSHRHAGGPGAGPVEVRHGDRDLFQLIDDARGVRVSTAARGWPTSMCSTSAAIEGKYGVPAAATPTSPRCGGDPSDGLPGVPAWARRPRPDW
jgi:hypothetical protein